ncbi:hypothetical protein GWI33_020728 [Rhynchophorus ferrugineus]|uniref:Uncharacterized protein n=1 Tax=Rhynchophorus ferrugineus TaxID=354439 RepID=A0A834M362_RHYFE|nr:hypothetical protein GWI33_020728 [Rhynchophorus ferrugineus]
MYALHATVPLFYPISSGLDILQPGRRAKLDIKFYMKWPEPTRKSAQNRELQANETKIFKRGARLATTEVSGWGATGRDWVRGGCDGGRSRPTLIPNDFRSVHLLL